MSYKWRAPRTGSSITDPSTTHPGAPPPQIHSTNLPHRTAQSPRQLLAWRDANPPGRTVLSSGVFCALKPTLCRTQLQNRIHAGRLKASGQALCCCTLSDCACVTASGCSRQHGAASRQLTETAERTAACASTARGTQFGIDAPSCLTLRAFSDALHLSGTAQTDTHADKQAGASVGRAGSRALCLCFNSDNKLSVFQQ